MDRVDLKALSKKEMDGFVRTLGWPPYRANQLRQWIYQKGASSFSEMTDLSKADRRILEESAFLGRLEVVQQQKALDGTRKFLFRLQDGQEIESVLIPGEETDEPRQPHRLTLCISTQVGCTLDCKFCLTGRMGLVRNLAAHEIAQQVLEVRGFGYRLTNFVLMGMGEPLANYTEVIEALHRLTDPQMGSISPRRITLSTSGLVPQIKRLGESGLQVNLAISLNATTDRVRERIMPAVNRIYPLKELMAACRSYPLSPRKWLTFEYVLLSGENDSGEDARRLVRLLNGMRCKVNLIPFNEFPGAPYRRPADQSVLRFQETLLRAKIPAFIRKSRGNDILAACGQLRTQVVGKTSSML